MTIEEIEARIAELAPLSRRLDPEAADRRRLEEETLGYGRRFLDRLPNAKTYVTPDSGAAEILDFPIAEEGRPISELVGLVERSVDGFGLNPASGGHLGYIPGGGIYPAALGDYMAATANRFAGICFASPGAVRMGNLLIDWMAELVGYPSGAGGDLTSGGSIANLIAIVTAREALGIRAADVPRSVIYATRHVHHSVGKARVIAGLRECAVRHVEMDDRFRMIPDDLQRKIAADRKAGLRPFMVVASAGTTDTGAVDPVEELAAVAKTSAEDMWFHVDAAYGGFFALCPEAPPSLAALHHADSLVLDPHKGLFLPYGSGAVLVRDREALRNAHWHAPPYLRDTWESEESPSPAYHSPELSRPFRALRLWLPLQLFGVAAFRACLSEKIWLARYFHERVQALPCMETGPAPELSVSLFRHVPPGRNANAANQELVERVHADGRVFISSTYLDQQVWLRFAALAFRTRKETVDTLLEVLGEAMASLRPSRPG